MLNHLHIRDFAIIDDTEVEPGPGMTALTGETGAGKSILLGALGLALGERASANSVRAGAERAEVSATFDVPGTGAIADWLAEHDLDRPDDDSPSAHAECVLRRTVTAAGKSRASINGSAVPVAQLKTLGAMLVAIHGQSAHHALGDASEQRRLLDAWKPSASAATVADAHDAWQAADRAWRDATEATDARQQRVDLLSFQLQEFDEAGLGGLQIADIESEHRWLANAESTRALGGDAIDALQDIASPALSGALRPLQTLAKLNDSLQEAFDLVESASIQVAEATSLLATSTSALETDEARLGWLDERLATMHRLAKKHRVEIGELDAVEQRVRDELDTLTGDGASVEALEAAREAAHRVYLEHALKLSRHRKRSAKALATTVTDSMQTLAMAGGAFAIEVDADTSRRERHGIDRITFTVSPNPGVPAAPLGRIASGGELSRIGLSLQLALAGGKTADTRAVGTLIFDEVDAGIGGAVAETVGRLLRSVGERTQVLCVTHLPQVAAQAHGHLKVEKSVENGLTATRLTPLDKRATRDEIARMLGGKTVTKKSLQHAQEMLDTAAG